MQLGTGLAQASFKEHAVVVLRRELEVEGRPLPPGSRGTVVHCYRDGVGYEVEFDEPFHAVMTVEAADLAS